MADGGGADVTGRVARFLAGMASAELPAPVIEKAKLHLLDSLAAMISGSRLPAGRAGLALVESDGGEGPASIPGTETTATALLATLAGGFSAHADETDDAHAPSITHPGCAVVPAALAVAQARRRDGLDLLRAVVAGYELCARTGLALGGERLFHLGRDTHSLGGVFGAAAAATVLHRLDEAAARAALSYAAQQASGLTTWYRDPDHIEKAFVFGAMPAHDGVRAAAMAVSGLTAVPDVFDGPPSGLDLLSPLARTDALTDGLGEDWAILSTDIKKWTVGSPVQAALDAITALVAEHGLTAERIRRIAIRLPSGSARVVDGRTMPNVNAQHLVALLVVDGGLGFETAHDAARMADPDVRALRARVTLEGDEALEAAQPARQAIVEVETVEGEQLRHHATAVRGSALNPMTWPEIEAKARDLTAPVLGGERAEALARAVRSIDRAPSLDGLRGLWAPS